ncbi:hypothetical protein E8E11_006197 [Didymella keratinophila]|nr:hypothetical protein E8E11_006197 [Didymella keratinophila]
MQNDHEGRTVVHCGQDLEKTARRNVLKKLNSFPPGLDALYDRMMQQINTSDDAELCKRALASMALVYRPITLAELVSLTESQEDVADEAELQEIIDLCGSLLTVRGDTVYFVHQSAQDFLLMRASDKVFPDGKEAAHSVVFCRSLAILSKTLQRDMYCLKAPGVQINDVQSPNANPLGASRYACIYWIDHLCDSKRKFGTNNAKILQDINAVGEFVRKKYLYWLEGLSLCKSTAKGGVQDGDELAKLFKDARRFIMYHKGSIESYPLQLCASALLFSPTESMIRGFSKHEEPKEFTIKPPMNEDWSACLQTLEGHIGPINSVAFSHNLTKLVSTSSVRTIKLWDASNGTYLQTLKGHSVSVMSAAFSHNSAKLASASQDNTVELWDVAAKG